GSVGETSRCHLGERGAAEGDEGDHAGEEPTVVVQGGADETRRERGEETEHGEPREHPGAGHEGRGSIAATEGHVLGSVPGTNRGRLDGFGSEAKPDDGEQEEAGEDRVWDYERGSHELGQRSREQCANSKA